MPPTRARESEFGADKVSLRSCRRCIEARRARATGRTTGAPPNSSQLTASRRASFARDLPCLLDVRWTIDLSAHFRSPFIVQVCVVFEPVVQHWAKERAERELERIQWGAKVTTATTTTMVTFTAITTKTKRRHAFHRPVSSSLWPFDGLPRPPPAGWLYQAERSLAKPRQNWILPPKASRRTILAGQSIGSNSLCCVGQFGSLFWCFIEGSFRQRIKIIQFIRPTAPELAAGCTYSPLAALCLPRSSLPQTFSLNPLKLIDLRHLLAGAAPSETEG